MASGKSQKKAGFPVHLRFEWPDLHRTQSTLGSPEGQSFWEGPGLHPCVRTGSADCSPKPVEPASQPLSSQAGCCASYASGAHKHKTLAATHHWHSTPQACYRREPADWPLGGHPWGLQQIPGAHAQASESLRAPTLPLDRDEPQMMKLECH